MGLFECLMSLTGQSSENAVKQKFLLGKKTGDAKYRCSETGYRIPFKCIEIEDGSKDANGKKSRNGRSTLETSDSNFERHRSLVDDSPTIEGKSQAYITYRSCIPAVNEEKLSVLGFEMWILSLECEARLFPNIFSCGQPLVQVAGILATCA
ncbi:Structural polyprotein [Tripterygium wilfordii]|uniref:Structural polyprotein n=1 Tax=Tripterygium wilfordii TaxID=458696 RepID=A0A7J7D4P1_TRIWF|nr:Structural polyprotein [Tripterygium wilfordii]